MQEPLEVVAILIYNHYRYILYTSLVYTVLPNKYVALKRIRCNIGDYHFFCNDHLL